MRLGSHSGKIKSLPVELLPPTSHPRRKNSRPPQEFLAPRSPQNSLRQVFASVAASFSWAICPCRRCRSAPFAMTPTLKICHPEVQQGTCLLRSDGIHHSRRQSQERAHRTPRHHEPTPSLYLRALIFSLCALCVKSFEVAVRTPP